MYQRLLYICLFVQRPEVVDWIQEGGGEVVDTQGVKNVDYTVESHGVLCSPAQFSGVTNVSSHWIRSCLQVLNQLLLYNHVPNKISNFLT